jgi:sarcosine oxidase subunit beta
VIAVLGGGAAGVAVGRALALAGRRDVTVFDPRPAGTGSTARAMGGFRTQHGSRLNIELALRSREWFASRGDRVGFRSNGYLYLAENAAIAEELRERAQVQTAAGLPIEHPDPHHLVPGLRAGDVMGANFCRLDGVQEPPLVLACLCEEAREAGADLRYESEVAASALDGAEAVVIAAGASSKAAGERMGVRLAVEPLERGVFEAGPFDWLPRSLPMVLEAGSGYHFRERDGRLRIMGPGDQRDWSHFRAWLQRRLPAAAVDAPSAAWTGDYEMTFDHHALVGETERRGTWACCGFSGHGLMQAPAVAESLAAMILGLTPPLDLSALSPLRTQPLLDRTQL